MNHITSTCTLLAAGSMLLGTSALAIDIDTFNDSTTQIVADVGAGGVGIFDILITPEAIGNERTLTIDSGTGTFGTIGKVENGQFSFINSTNSAGSVQIGYGLAVPLGGVDISDGGASDQFIFTIDFSDAVVDYEIILLDTNANSVTASGTFPTGVTSSQDFFVAFSDFGAFDFTDVDEIVIDFDPNGGVLGADLSLDSIRTGVVPEPSSLALLALGGLAMVRRRR